MRVSRCCHKFARRHKQAGHGQSSFLRHTARRKLRRAAWGAQRGARAAGSRTRRYRTRRGDSLRSCASLVASARRCGASVGRQRTREPWLRVCRGVVSLPISGFYCTITTVLPTGIICTVIPRPRGYPEAVRRKGWGGSGVVKKYQV